MADRSSSVSVSSNAANSKLRSTAFKIDDLIQHFARVLQSRDNSDAIILFLCYGAQFGASVLETPMPSATGKLASLSPKLFRHLNQIIKPVRSSVPRSKLSLSTRLRNLSRLLEDWSTLTRLWGLVSVWATARELLRDISGQRLSEPQNGGQIGRVFDKSVASAQVIALASFFVLENAALLSTRKVLNWSSQTHSRVLTWCIRSWGFYIFSEVGKLLVEKVRGREGDEKSADTGPAKPDDWSDRFVRTSLWAPLVVHWSTDGGILPEPVAAALAAYPMFLMVRDSWRQTA